MATNRSAKQNEELLERINKRFLRYREAWREIQEEGDTDMRYIVNDPWDPRDKKDRKDSGRPMLRMDELSQYTNQAINNFRQNTPGIKISPAGGGATSKTAEFHQDLIRGIEYRSSAQRNAYTPAYENAINRGYGFFRLKRKWSKGKKWEQEIEIEGIANPNSVLFDPDVMKPDWSDATGVFVCEPIKKDYFKRRFPKAEIKDFGEAQIRQAPEFLKGDEVIVAEYYEATIKPRKLLLIETPQGDHVFYEDELPEDYPKDKVMGERNEDARTITKYLTNGVEILEENVEPGEIIPIVPVIGKELFLQEGGTTKRVIMSMVRLARDPQMAYNYLWTLEAEEASLTPKTPWIGYKGQFESARVRWETCSKIPTGFLEVDVVIDGATGQVLPLPQRPQFTPNFQAYEVSKDSARRAIQAAFGITPLPTAAQRNNEKSGVALEKIESQESVGSFHFTDNLHRSLELAGKIIESWIPVVYDTTGREIGIRKSDGTHKTVKINTAEPYPDPEGAQNQDGSPVMHHYPIVSPDGEPVGEHDVTISTGPSYQSQRAAASDFVDTLIQNIEALPLTPQQKAQLFAIAIELKQLGPLGDQMVKIVKGDPNAQHGQQAIAQLQQSQQILQQLQGELQKMQMEKMAKTQELSAKAQLAQIDNNLKLELAKLADRTKIIVAMLAKQSRATEIEAQSDAEKLLAQMEDAAEAHQQGAEQAHELALQKDQQVHEVGLQQQDQAHAADMQAQQEQAQPEAQA